jgi:protein involved in polysaccharide export with SLBB domain
MKMKEPLLLVIIIAVALVSCARYPNIPRVEETARQGEQAPSTIEAGEKDYVIGPEDVLEIQVWDNPDLEQEVSVSRQGDFSYTFIGKIHAAGLTVGELEEEIASRLSDGYIVDPQVMVTVTKLRERYFYVFGEVKNPGKYEFEQGTTVLKAITTAGGVTDIASINRTKVVREEEGMRKKLKVKMNDPVFPEDIIIVPESFF